MEERVRINGSLFFWLADIVVFLKNPHWIDKQQLLRVRYVVVRLRCGRHASFRSVMLGQFGQWAIETAPPA